MNPPRKFAAVLLLVLLAATSLPSFSPAELLPEFRPALIANTKRSLINAIDVQSLARRGQGNATVMFSCLVSTLGISFDGFYFRGKHDADKRGTEVARRCQPAGCSTAAYNHHVVGG